ncbi:hypothetical protein GGI06_004869, partial [Coemansia sp. S85]
MTPGTPLPGKLHMHRSRRSNNSSGYTSSTRHRSSGSKGQQGGSSSAQKVRASNAAAKGGRFHHLQVEQTMSENDDANSVTTTASDSNDVADTDGQVPASSLRHRYRLSAQQPLAASDSEAGSTPAPLPAAEYSTPTPNAMDVDGVEPKKEDMDESRSDLAPPVESGTSDVAELDGDNEAGSNGDDGSQPGSPLSESPLSDENSSQQDELAAPADETLV